MSDARTLLEAVIEQAKEWRQTGDNYSAIQYERAAAALEGIARRAGADVSILGEVSLPPPQTAPADRPAPPQIELNGGEISLLAALLRSHRLHSDHCIPNDELQKKLLPLERAIVRLKREAAAPPVAGSPTPQPKRTKHEKFQDLWTTIYDASANEGTILCDDTVTAIASAVEAAADERTAPPQTGWQPTTNPPEINARVLVSFVRGGFAFGCLANDGEGGTVWTDDDTGEAIGPAAWLDLSCLLALPAPEISHSTQE